MGWIPLAIQGGAAIYGAIKSHNAAKKAEAERQTALQGAQGASTALTQRSQQLFGAGMPPVQSSLDYYSTLLRGSRAAMANATAGPRGAITDTYRGATRNLEHSGLTGASKDQATADLNRDRSAKIAGLTSGVQPQAAGAMADIGTGLIGGSNSTLGASGQLWSGLLGQGSQQVQYANQQGADSGSAIGKFLFDALSQYGGKFGGGGSFTPPTPGNPNVGPSTLPPGGFTGWAG